MNSETLESINCGRACGFQEPYGFVPEADCPVHDPIGGTTMRNERCPHGLWGGSNCSVCDNDPPPRNNTDHPAAPPELCANCGQEKEVHGSTINHCPEPYESYFGEPVREEMDNASPYRPASSPTDYDLIKQAQSERRERFAASSEAKAWISHEVSINGNDVFGHPSITTEIRACGNCGLRDGHAEYCAFNPPTQSTPAEGLSEAARTFIDGVYRRDGEGVLDADELASFAAEQVSAAIDKFIKNEVERELIDGYYDARECSIVRQVMERAMRSVSERQKRAR